MKSPFTWKLLLPLGVALLISGCVALDEAGDTASTGPIKLGGLAPLSGDGAAYGIPLRRVAELALGEINIAGGAGGRQLELAYEDGGCNADSGNRAAQRLVDVEKVKIVLGGTCSSETLAAAPITERNKVILFSSAASSPDLSKAGDFVFRNYPSDLTQGKIIAQFAITKGLKKVGMITEQQDYTLGIQQAFEEEFTKSGGTVLKETYLSDASDFKSQITKLKGEGVDAYFINSQTPAKGDLVVKQMQELEIKAQFLMNDVVIGYTDLVKKYAEYLEGAVGAEASYDRANPGVAKLQAAYKTKFNEELPYLPYTTAQYDGVYIVAEAIAAVGADDTEKLRDYFYALKGRKGLAGTLTMDANGDPLAGHVLRTVKAGKVEDYRGE